MKITTRREDVFEDYHGTKVHDPYRWLEVDSEEVNKWADEQNAWTKKYLDTFLKRNEIKARLTEKYNYEKYFLPKKIGDFYYFQKNDGLQNQPVLYRSRHIDLSEAEIILNPNEMNPNGTTALMDYWFTKDGSLMAYAISHNGSDWQEIRIMDMKTKEVYPEVLHWAKFAQLTWKPDNSGFYYDRYLDPKEVTPEEESFYNKVYFHTLNTDQSEDQIVYEVEGKREYRFVTTHSDDHKYLIFHVHSGTEPINRVHIKATDRLEEIKLLIDEPQGAYQFLGNVGMEFYFLTNDMAPNSKVISININQEHRSQWKEVIAESEQAIEFVELIYNHFVVCVTEDAKSVLKLYDLTGQFIKTLPLPEFITVEGVSGQKTESEMLIAYSSFLHPTKISKYDFETADLTTIIESELNFDASAYETKQVFYPSKDGEKIPMFLTYKKGIKLDGNNPVLLYSYGGYSVSLSPSFYASQQLWLESGGIYAVANIRGGGEYGEKWHKAAILENRQVSFNDFISAAEWLIDQEYSNNERIAIMGMSNGGLLVATCIVQRPDLFGAGLSLVPVTDMLRFHRFTVGRFWTTEFGNAEENPEHFEFLYKYSPIHNVKEGNTYPATMVTTADTDDRVVPMHAYKFAATLQYAQAGEDPILLRVEKNAGHGQGKPISKVIAEETDIYTFLFKQFEIDL